MRKLGAVVSAMFLVLAFVTPLSAATGGSAPKTTGDASFDRTSEGLGMAHVGFVAQATSPAKGSFTYSDPNGAYTITVQNVKIDSATVVHFAGPVVTSTYPGIGVGLFVAIAVRDGGEPGIGVDRLNGNVYGSLSAAVAGYAALSPDYLTVADGNLQVLVKVCTFTASDSSYYNGPDPSAPLYGTGPITFSWLQETGDVYAGLWSEIVPPVSGTTYSNVFASGSVNASVVHLMTTVRSSDNYPAFAVDGTLANGVFTGTAAGPYALIATGTVACGVFH